MLTLDREHGKLTLHHRPMYTSVSALYHITLYPYSPYLQHLRSENVVENPFGFGAYFLPQVIFRSLFNAIVLSFSNNKKSGHRPLVGVCLSVSVSYRKKMRRKIEEAFEVLTKLKNTWSDYAPILRHCGRECKAVITPYLRECNAVISPCLRECKAVISPCLRECKAVIIPCLRECKAVIINRLWECQSVIIPCLRECKAVIIPRLRECLSVINSCLWECKAVIIPCL